MRGNVISYNKMCLNEGTSLQKGMNFRLKGKSTIILMSVRPNSPYKDEVSKDGTTLIYEGHDIPKIKGIRDPKLYDQPEYLSSGKLTENGKFHQAAQAYKLKVQAAEVVHVYEKIKAGIWSDNGFFHLVDSWKENDDSRRVFKFKLIALDIDYSNESKQDFSELASPGRLIPTSVKLEVWARDKGKCVTCGATDELHFDHILPFSKGGTSLKAENIQLLCARHNLSKSAKIL